MTVIIDGTSGVTSVNGSAAAPSVTGTDTDTGIVYGTNTLSLATGGTTAVTVDSSQRIFSGTTAAITPANPLRMQLVAGNVAVDSGAGGQTLTLVSNDTTSSTNKGAAIGLGGYATDTAAYVMFGAIAGRYQGTGNTGYLQFSTLDSGGTMSERARIDASGNLLVGATTTLAGGTGLTVSTDGRSVNATIGIKAHAAAGYDARLYMECPGSNAGGLTYQRSTGRLYAYSQTENSGPYVVPNGTSWTTNSDERLKTDIEDIAYGLSAVMELSPKQYKYKTNDKTSLGLIAQQAALVIPEIVEVPEDAELMMGIEYTGLIPVLVKAIQEQQALIEQLRADVEALKAA